MIMKVPARYFSPQPKVDSAVIAINNISRERFSASSARPCLAEFGQVNEEKFWQIIHAGFAHKRKKLAGNLKSMLKDKKELLLIYGNKRAEDLSLSDWISLART
jgi:16S rRNA A1518/A1519 N6-dimethyltransferase RsmA/KsgA/DIM1 with predicted DNA glycosylase/AP lyase activity